MILIWIFLFRKIDAKKVEIVETSEDAKRFGERPPESELMKRKADFDAEQKSFDEREKGEGFYFLKKVQLLMFQLCLWDVNTVC